MGRPLAVEEEEKGTKKYQHRFIMLYYAHICRATAQIGSFF
jgi:hypothetical protein